MFGGCCCRAEQRLPLGISFGGRTCCVVLMAAVVVETVRFDLVGLAGGGSATTRLRLPCAVDAARPRRARRKLEPQGHEEQDALQRRGDDGDEPETPAGPADAEPEADGPQVAAGRLDQHHRDAQARGGAQPVGRVQLRQVLQRRQDRRKEAVRDGVARYRARSSLGEDDRQQERHDQVHEVDEGHQQCQPEGVWLLGSAQDVRRRAREEDEEEEEAESMYASVSRFGGGTERHLFSGGETCVAGPADSRIERERDRERERGEADGPDETHMTLNPNHCTPTCASPSTPAKHSKPETTRQQRRSVTVLDSRSMLASALEPAVDPSRRK